MPSRAQYLQDLDQTVAQLLAVCQIVTDPNVAVYEDWSLKDVLAHLTFWHESFARNVADLANDRPPKPLRGRLMDLNRDGVDSMQSETLTTVMARFQAAHQVIQENILYPNLTFIPYRKGSRDYTPEEHLEVVEQHIAKHLKDIRKVLKR